jgi:ENTS family enterobactin (siderophore) exporter
VSARLGGLVIDVSPLRTSRPFRLLFTARLVTLLAIGLLVVAVPAQVYQLTGSSVQVAGVTATLGVATFVGGMAGGVLADRFERRRTIEISRTVAGLGFLLLGVNAVLPEPTVVLIYLGAAIDGLAGGVSGTALMAATAVLVPREKLAAAGALVALTTDLGTVLSPAVAGLIIAAGWLPVTYFVAVAATAATVTLVNRVGPVPAPGTSHEVPLRALATGLRFAGRQPLVRGVLLVGLLTMLAGGPMVLLPAFVDQVLHAGPTTLGVLYAAPALGAVLGSLSSGWTGRVRHSGIALLIAVAVMSLGIALLGVAAAAVVAFLGLAGHGLGRALADILRFAVLQHNTPDELRGRISALWQVQVVVGTAVGSVLAGLLGEWFDPGSALLVYGLAGVVLTALLVVAVQPVWRVRNELTSRGSG